LRKTGGGAAYMMFHYLTQPMHQNPQLPQGNQLIHCYIRGAGDRGRLFFLEERFIDLNALHQSFHKLDSKEKENYKEAQNSCSSSSKPSEIRSSPPPNPLPDRRRAPEPISTRWRLQTRAYF
jgi:hypothetical protein